MTSMDLTINGLKCHLQTWGNASKPPLFLLHGWLDMGASFDFVCQGLQDKYYCIAPDFRGMGQSQHNPNEVGYFFFEYLADIHRIFDHFSPDQTIQAVGHSMGGNVLALYAGSYPERVRHIINIEGFGILNMPAEMGPERLKTWIDGLGSKSFKVYAELDQLAARLQKSNSRLTTERAQFLAKHLSRKVDGGYQIAADPNHKYVNPYLFQLENIYPFWESITAHCLLVSAEHTNMQHWITKEQDFKAEMDRRLKHFPAHSKQLVISDSGHMIHHDQPEVLAQHIINFLK